MIERNPGRWKLLGAALVAAAAVVALGITLVYRIDVGQRLKEQTHANCVQLEQLKGAILLVFKDGHKNLQARRSALTASEYARLEEYYDRQFRRFAPKQC